MMKQAVKRKNTPPNTSTNVVEKREYCNDSKAIVSFFACRKYKQKH